MDLDGPVLTAPQVAKLAGYAQVNALDRRRLGPHLGLEPVGSGNYRTLTPRQAVIACILADVLEETNGRSGHRAAKLADALRRGGWSGYLVLGDYQAVWVDTPEEVMDLIQTARSTSAATVVPMQPYLDRVRRALS
jgi:hypothetical protein